MIGAIDEGFQMHTLTQWSAVPQFLGHGLDTRIQHSESGTRSANMTAANACQQRV